MGFDHLILKAREIFRKNSWCVPVARNLAFGWPVGGPLLSEWCESSEVGVGREAIGRDDWKKTWGFKEIVI